MLTARDTSCAPAAAVGRLAGFSRRLWQAYAALRNKPLRRSTSHSADSALDDSWWQSQHAELEASPGRGDASPLRLERSCSQETSRSQEAYSPGSHASEAAMPTPALAARVHMAAASDEAADEAGAPPLPEDQTLRVLANIRVPNAGPPATEPVNSERLPASAALHVLPETIQRVWPTLPDDADADGRGWRV